MIYFKLRLLHTACVPTPNNMLIMDSIRCQSTCFCYLHKTKLKRMICSAILNQQEMISASISASIDVSQIWHRKTELNFYSDVQDLFFLKLLHFLSAFLPAATKQQQQSQKMFFVNSPVLWSSVLYGDGDSVCFDTFTQVVILKTKRSNAKHLKSSKNTNVHKIDIYIHIVVFGTNAVRKHSFISRTLQKIWTHQE